MTDLRKAAEMALEALHNIDQSNNDDAIEALRQALAEPANSTTDFVEPKASSQTEQEPLVWMNKYGHVASFQNEEYKDPLYTAPPKREWVGLTDEEIDAAVKSCNTLDTYKYFRAIEAKLKEKNS